MSDFPGWTFDYNRRLYYYWSTNEQQYIYQNGLRSRTLGQPQTAAAAPRPSSPTPRTTNVDPHVISQEVEEEDDDDDGEDGDDDKADGDDDANAITSGINNVSLGGPSYSYSARQSTTQPTYSSGYGTSTPATTYTTYAGYGGGGGYSAPSASRGYPAYSSAYGAPVHQASGYGMGQSSMPGASVISRAVDKDADPLLKQIGVVSRGRIRGTYGDRERLNPEYKVRRPGKKFFKTGKVFKVLWPELAGNNNPSVTITSDRRFEDEGIATKIRWFIVVREGKGFCSCLPINTYNRQGVAKRGVAKWQHAVAFSSKHEPSVGDDEMPGAGETAPMMPGIRIKPRQRSGKLDPKSRIDFGRVYTVEHNVKVYDFGEVHEDFKSRLVTQWIRVIQQDVQSGGGGVPPAMPDSDDSEDEDDEDDEDEEDEDAEGSDDAEDD